ncbi:hypothetical protein CH63R_00852 [Colletotrichum higginsianum IMI 349063]|uniref:Uncharacterized protein n=1 Tax=Colletotrichum higginsianum (strain IMI 349063) TaxID=759273 RepID=A0A1B7YUN6_COLHI|nr:hypothetical protein CH63R_00852 [Colletotrichum higginsianum IMI 349063]OBR15672.1 hypothetical protein CH63R_00852 [Colletotrichum higginsianum IMI 349063]
MENIHAQRRSASHGSLRSSYKTQARPTVGHSLPRRLPLRSVNENASLLPSPGPLESMLKTTTETGDIGIFSIKPVAPATTIHHYARSRSGLDTASIFRSDSSATDGKLSRAAGCRQRTSDRDNNSEIISMYGSEGPLYSFSSSLPPRHDSMYHRSYSMTSCGSRHVSSQKSSGTLQSQSSNGILQRPRSPFPYPTRLKRPGVRPSSPALTENGLVDYSRMVEIDRISYPQRLAPPLAFRSGAIQSLPCLPKPNYLVSPTGSIVRHRDNNHWGDVPLDRTYRPSTDHSVRSSSLTSVIEMYCRSPSNSEQNFQRQLRPAGSFYYDYTEGFENSDPQADLPKPAIAPPLAPVPQRASSLVKALVLRDETKARLEAVVDISVKDSSDSYGGDGRVTGSNTANDIETLPSQRGSCKTAPPTLELFPFEVDGTSGSHTVDFGPASDMFEVLSCYKDVEPSLTVQNSSTPSCLPLVDTGIPSDEEQSRNEEKKAIQDQDPASGPEQSPPHNDACRHLYKGSQSHSKTWEEMVPDHGETQKMLDTSGTQEHGPREVPSHTGFAALLRSSLRHSVDPGLSDLAALVSSFERIAKSSFMKKDKEVSGTTESAEKAGLRNSQQPEEQPIGTETVPGDEAAADNGPHTAIHSKRSFYKGHQRNRALARISMGSLRGQRGMLASSAGLPLLAPEPVSPARALRVSSSIPQLTKPLPSLPRESPTSVREALQASVDEMRFPVKFSPFQVEILATPRSSPRITTHPNVEDHESFRASIELDLVPCVGGQALKEGAETMEGSAQSKDLDSARQPNEKHILNNQVLQEEPSPSKRRIRLRASRPGLKVDAGYFQQDQSGTVRKHRSFEQGILTGLPTRQTEDLLTPIRHGGRRSSTAYQQRGRQFVLLTPDEQEDGENHQARRSPTARVSRDRFLHERNIPLAHPVDASSLRRSASTDEFHLSDSRSFSSELTFIRPRVLRKKLSYMRIRLTRSRLKFRDRVNKTSERRPRHHGATDSDGTVAHGQRPIVPPDQPKQMGRKMRRWIRRTVRVFVKGRQG